MNLRRTACALALPAFPLTLLAATLISPTDSTKNTVQLAAARTHGPAWAGAATLELLATALIPLAVAAIVHAVRGRGAALANTGAVLGILGTLGMAAIAFRHVFIYGLAAIDRAQALHALDRVDHTFGTLVLPLMFFAPVAFIVLAGAAVRAKIAPRWVPVAAFVFFVSDMLPIPGAEIIQQLVGITTFAVLARAVLTGPAAERRTTQFKAATAEA